jgi:Na+-driven multidrug efflux pump
LLPASLNLGITHVLAPALNGLMTRSVEPEAAIGGYAIAMGVMGLVALPQMRIQQLTLVFLDDQGSLGRLRRFVALFALLSGLVAAVVAFTPVHDLLLDSVFATTGALRTESAAALVALAPFPVLAIVRTHLYGVALRIGRPRLIWLGTGAGAVAVIVVAAVVLLLDPSAGASIAAIAVTAGAAVETVVLVAGTTGPLQRDLEPSDGSPPTYTALLRFFGPLLFAAFLPSVTQPVINAILTRAPEPEAGVAAVSLTFGINQIFLIALWGVQPTLLALMGRGESPAAARRFANIVGLITVVPAAVVAFIPPLTSLVVHDLLGATGRLQEMTEAGLRILALLPPVFVQEAIYTSAILRVRRAHFLVYVNAIRLVGLVAILLIGVGATNLSGGVIGIIAIGGALVIEAVATVAFGLGAQRQLERGWQPQTTF